MEGPLEKLARGPFSRWQPRYFKSEGHALVYRAPRVDIRDDASDEWLGGVNLLGDECSIALHRTAGAPSVLTVTGLCADVRSGVANERRGIRTFTLRQQQEASATGCGLASIVGDHSIEEWANALLLTRALLRARGEGALLVDAPCSTDGVAQASSGDGPLSNRRTAQRDMLGWTPTCSTLQIQAHFAATEVKRSENPAHDQSFALLRTAGKKAAGGRLLRQAKRAALKETGGKTAVRRSLGVRPSALSASEVGMHRMRLSLAAAAAVGAEQAVAGVDAERAATSSDAASSVPGSGLGTAACTVAAAATTVAGAWPIAQDEVEHSAVLPPQLPRRPSRRSTDKPTNPRGERVVDAPTRRFARQLVDGPGFTTL